MPVDVIPSNVPLASAAKTAERDYPNKPEYVPDTPADLEINRALAEGRRVNLDAAYPDPPPLSNEVTGAISRHTQAMGPYAVEYRLKLLHRMMLRNLPDAVMQEALKVSQGTLLDLKKNLRKALAAQAKTFDIQTHVGSSIAFFEEVRGVAMSLATDSKNASGSRVAALGVALEAQKDTIRFMQAIGAYQANPMQWNRTDDKELQSAMLLQEMAEAFLSGDDSEVDFIPKSGRDDEEDDNIRLINGM